MPPFDWSNIARRDEMLDRFTGVDRQFISIDRQFISIDQRFNTVDTRLTGVETRVTGVETRLTKVEDGLLHVGLRIDALNHTLSVGTMGLVITLVLGFSSIFTAILLSA